MISMVCVWGSAGDINGVCEVGHSRGQLFGGCPGECEAVFRPKAWASASFPASPSLIFEADSFPDHEAHQFGSMVSELQGPP